MTPLEDKYAGCLVGKAVGDALGAPVEFKGWQTCRDFCDQHVRPLDFEGVVRTYEGPFPYGQYTDDTQLARELAISIKECGNDFHPAHFAARMVKIFQSGKMVGTGNATHMAVDRLIQGRPWSEAGTPAPAAGNGSAMRAAPIGMAYRNRYNMIPAMAKDQAVVTHSDPRAVAGSVAMAMGVDLLLSEGLTKKFLPRISLGIGKDDPILSQSLLAMETMANWEPEEALKVINTVGLQPERYDNAWSPGISPFVTTSVLWSFYSFLHTPSDYIESICTALWPGGDVDTTGAMTGALSGALNGLSAIPEEARDPITDRGTWGAQELADLAISLIGAP